MKVKIIKVIVIFVCILVMTSCVNHNKHESKTTLQGKMINENTEEYKIKENIIFYVLQDEYLENNDVKNPNVSELIRVFICYDGVKNQIYPNSIVVFFEKTNTIQEFRDSLVKKNTGGLKLPPNTIVSSQVLDKWKEQGYNGLSSYTDESPMGLDYSQLK
mgnify:FL=1